jgi:signal transduction histidine kinase
MPSWQSIRFRLSVQYSALVFGLGGGLLGLVYLATQRWLRNQTMMATVITGQKVVIIEGRAVIVPEMAEIEARAIESIYNEIVLDRVAQFILIALVALFILSIVVGWVMSGRVLKPVAEIAAVAREIQASDLSRRIALEGPDDEIKQLGDTFDEMLERLDTAFTSQRQFLADTSHDLRTPLTVIRSNVDLAASDPNAGIEEWREAGTVIKRNAEKMSTMIADLLASARLQTGKSIAVSVDLGSLVEAKTADFAPIADTAGIRLKAHPGPVTVQGVEVALDRAMNNLIENALKVAPAGSEVRLGSGVAGGWAWLGVADDGPGLPDDPSARIGLGLSIVTQIAEGHSGSLARFSGNGGEGTTMVIWLPLDSSEWPHPAENPFTGS